MRLAAGAALLLHALVAAAEPAACVVLLHGLARGPAFMEPLAAGLVARGYRVANVGYPSRQATVEPLAERAVPDGVERCREGSAARVHFVTHSLGGILVRQHLARHELPRLGRVVMLAPPNRGSELVDALSRVPGFGLINGPAGRQLGTGDDSVPLALGPADFELGVIAGARSWNPLFSLFLPDADDGRVSVARTRVEGMDDFAVVRRTHRSIVRGEEVLRLVAGFLETGRFPSACGGDGGRACR